MAGEIASAYLSIYPKLEASKVVDEVAKTMSGAGRAAGEEFAQNAQSAMQNRMGEAGTAGGNALADGFGVAKVALGNIISNLAMDAANEFKERFSDGIAQSDALQKFASTMSFAGFDTKEIEGVRTAMKGYADQTVYDLGEVMDTTAKLAANGVNDYQQLVQAAGNLNAAAGGNSESFGYFANAITQVNGTGKLMAQDWNQIINALPGASGAIQKELASMGAWDSSMMNFKDAMAGGEISAEEFNAALTNLGMTDVAQQAATSTTTFEGAMGQLDAAVTNTMQGIYDKLNENGRITDAINSLAQGFETIAPVIADVAGKFGDLLAFIAPVVPVVVAFVGALAAASAVSTAFTFITTVVIPAITAIQSFGGAIAVVTTVLGGPIPIIAAVVAAIVAFLATNEDARAKVLAVFDAIKSAITSAMNTARSIISSAASTIRSLWSSAMDSLSTTVRNAMSTVRSVLGSLHGIVTGALSGAGSWLVSAGKNIISGLCNGIRGAVSWVTDAVSSVCSNAIGALKSFFGIKSPSRLMAKMGEYMMAGLAIGIDDGAAMAVGAMEGASYSVASALGMADGSASAYGPAAAFGGMGTSYNVYIDGARVNDDQGIQDVLLNFFEVLQRRGAMNVGTV